MLLSTHSSRPGTYQERLHPSLWTVSFLAGESQVPQNLKKRALDDLSYANLCDKGRAPIS